MIDLTLILIMVTCGVLGGSADLLRNDDRPLSIRRFLTYALYGTIASLMVPLFLNMISSNLMNQVSTDPTSALVFVGFCLVASVSSGNFIRRVTQQMMEKFQDDIENVKKESKEIVSSVEPIIASNVALENSMKNESVDNDTVTFEQKKDSYSGRPIGTHEVDIPIMILGVIASEGKSYVSFDIIASKMDIDENLLLSNLIALEEEGMIIRLYKNSQKLYGLTFRGRAVSQTFF